MMRGKAQDRFALATKSSGLALVGAFCGSVLVGGLAAAVCEYGAWGIKGDTAPVQGLAIARPGEGVSLPPASGAGRGGGLLNAKFIKPAVADVGPTMPVDKPAATAGQGPVEQRTVGIAEVTTSEPGATLPLPLPIPSVGLADRIESPNAADALADTQNASTPSTDRLALATEGPQRVTARAEDDAKAGVVLLEAPVECLVAELCIEDYLWSLYEKTPKVDTNKVRERIKALITKKGKTRISFKVVTKYVTGDFGWKDPAAAQRSGMQIKDYVIGGMDPVFKVQLYRALRAMDAAGFMPGITSAFRDDYRQSIAIGRKAASDSSYHGGSRRGGYGHGLAADLVSLKGETRAERYASSKELWAWIDANEKELGIGRPYLDRDPPHVASIGGKEYADKRGAKARIAGAR